MSLKLIRRAVLGVLAAVMVLLAISACFPADDTPPDMSVEWKQTWLTDAVLTADGDTVMDFSHPERSGEMILKAGKAYTLTAVNNTNKPISVVVYIGGGTASLAAAGGFVTVNVPKKGEASFTLTPSDDTDISACVGLSRDGESMLYTRGTDALDTALAKSNAKHIVMLGDASFEGDYIIRRPAEIINNGHKLTVGGTLAVETDAAGTVAFWNTSHTEYAVAGFFVHAPSCDLTVKTAFFNFNGRDAFYHTVKSINGTVTDPASKTIRDTAMLEALCDGDRYPKLTAGMTVRFADGVSLRDTDAVFTVPVNFVFEGSFAFEAPIRVETDQAGNITVKNIGGAKVEGEHFDIDAPMCDLSVENCSIDIYDVLEYMNLMSFNKMNLSECVLGGDGTGTVSSIEMTMHDNRNLSADVKWTVDGDYIRGTVSCVLDPDLLRGASLRVKADGVYSFSEGCLTDDGYVDLLSPTGVFITVTDENGGTRRYAVVTEYVPTRIPTIVIEVENGAVIDSLTEYKVATIKINSENTNGEFPSLETTTVNIRGRGNSTWGWDKKPYKLKFPQKTSVLGMTANKDWTLLANYADKSLIRNPVAMHMASVLDGMPFAMHQYPVDLFVNGEYLGVYTLGEQIEVKKDRVDIDVDLNVNNVDTGYLLQIGGTSSADTWDVTCFYTNFLRYVKIEEPEDEYLTRERVKYIKDWCIAADNAVVAGVGYEEYIDVDTLIDWVILHELTYNLDSCFHRSVFIVKQAGGKLQMGPAWDFDLAMGNMSRDYGKYDIWVLPGVDDEDAYIKLNWLNYLYYNEDFCRKMEARWNEVKDELLSSTLALIDDLYFKVAPSAEYNFEVWDILGKKVAFEPSYTNKYDTYEKQIGYLRSFLQDRWTWIDSNISSLPMAPAAE